MTEVEKRRFKIAVILGKKISSGQWLKYLLKATNTEVKEVLELKRVYYDTNKKF